MMTRGPDWSREGVMISFVALERGAGSHFPWPSNRSEAGYRFTEGHERLVALGSQSPGSQSYENLPNVSSRFAFSPPMPKLAS